MSDQVWAPVIVAPGKIELQQFPLPDPEPGAVLIRREMCGICGTDKHTYQGFAIQYSGTDHERSLPFPIIPGHEIVGTIAAIGQGPDRLTDFYGQPLEEGDRVVLGANLTCGHCYYCRHGFEYYFCANLEDYGNSLSAATLPISLAALPTMSMLFPEVTSSKYRTTSRPKSPFSLRSWR